MAECPESRLRSPTIESKSLQTRTPWQPFTLVHRQENVPAWKSTASGERDIAGLTPNYTEGSEVTITAGIVWIILAIPTISLCSETPDADQPDEFRWSWDANRSDPCEGDGRRCGEPSDSLIRHSSSSVLMIHRDDGLWNTAVFSNMGGL